jgi:Ca2+/Na+ antiporter
VDIIFDLTPQEVENELKYDPDFFSRIASVLLPGGDFAHAMMLSSCGCQRLLYSSMVCCIFSHKTHENHTHGIPLKQTPKSVLAGAKQIRKK